MNNQVNIGDFSELAYIMLNGGDYLSTGLYTGLSTGQYKYIRFSCVKLAKRLPIGYPKVSKKLPVNKTCKLLMFIYKPIDVTQRIEKGVHAVSHCARTLIIDICFQHLFLIIFLVFIVFGVTFRYNEQKQALSSKLRGNLGVTLQVTLG